VLELLTENTSAESPKTCLETFLDNWWKQIYDRLESLRSNLHREDYKSILDDFISVYYFPNFEEYWKELLPQSTDKVVAHTDMQETNILVLKPTPFEKDNLKLMIIDYEYAGLVERSWDLANYYIETMLSN
jgi:thiamine kinase-like enzyme